jgi:hypothetical protein
MSRPSILARPRAIFALAFLALSALAAPAGEPFRYAEGKHGKGELKCMGGLPVLVLEGSPEEMGEQMGALALKQIGKMTGKLKDMTKQLGFGWPVMVRLSQGLFNRFPEPYRRELEAMARASGVDRDFLIVANTMSDVRSLAGCSAVTVEAERSATGQVLFGRNWDFWPHLDLLHQYSLVVVRRPAGKRAFADVGFPGLLIAGSTFNDAGLAMAPDEITRSKDKAPRYVPSGVTVAVAGRRLMEECGSVAEAEKLARSLKPTGLASVAFCDPKGGAVFEVTPKTFVVRRAEEGICAATNHFRAPELAVDTRCPRYEVFAKCRQGPKLTVADLGKKLHAANQVITIHSMVFEPATLKLHLSLAPPPASAGPLRLLELGPLFKQGERQSGE